MQVILVMAAAPSYSQEITEEQWEILRDNYAASIIILMTRLDTLNIEIDSTKKILKLKEDWLQECEAELLALIGTTKEGVADYRRKFEETEKKISSKSGTPSDARRMYFDELSSDKIHCLPEFAERFESIKKKLHEWEGYKPVVGTEGTYAVVRGDCLWKISILKYNSPYYWPAIWEANKNGVMNKDELSDPHHKAITNPNLIYPGQVLRIPALNSSQKLESIEKFKKFRKEHFKKE